jgi:hypothetical protein
MICGSLLVVTLLAAEAAFPLRTEGMPKEWKLEEINDGLPYRWEPGEVHVLAWEVIEDDRPWKVTQALVLKRFDKPTEKGGHRWVLAQVYQQTRDAERPWATPFRPPPPFPKGAADPQPSDAHVFGYEFFAKPPSDAQIAKFLAETHWTPRLGKEKTATVDGTRILTTTLTAGGVDRDLWKKLLERDMKVELLPELKLPDTEKK